MRLTAFLLPFALMADPCTRLCELDGLSICTEGSYSKNGVCHRYLFRGDPALNDYCYHTSATASTCPSSGKPVTIADAQRLVALRGGNGAIPPRNAVGPGPHVRRTVPRAVPREEPLDFEVEMDKAYMRFLQLRPEEQARELEMQRERLIEWRNQLAREPVRTPPPTFVPTIETTLRPVDSADGNLHSRLAQLVGEERGIFGRPHIHFENVHNFWDSIGFLNGPVENLFAGTVYLSLPGMDGYSSGCMNEWIDEVTLRLFAVESGFFVESATASPYLSINPEGPRRPRANEVYRAVGRFLALSLIRDRPLGVNLPVGFYSALIGQPVLLDEVNDEEPLLFDPDLVPTLNLIRQGFNEVLPTARVSALFSAGEIKALISGNSNLNMDDFLAHATIQFTTEDQLNWFLDIVRGFNQEQLRNLLFFASGLTRTPIGGFAHLRPRISIYGALRSADEEENIGWSLPNHQITIPLYRNQDEMRRAILYAIGF